MHLHWWKDFYPWFKEKELSENIHDQITPSPDFHPFLVFAMQNPPPVAGCEQNEIVRTFQHYLYLQYHVCHFGWKF